MGVIKVKDDPEPVGETILVVTENKTVARCKRWINGRGKPIMAVYPKDNAPKDHRVIFPPGVVLVVYKEIIKADGGGKYQAVKYSYADHKPYTLYVRVTDVKKRG